MKRRKLNTIQKFLFRIARKPKKKIRRFELMAEALIAQLRENRKKFRWAIKEENSGEENLFFLRFSMFLFCRVSRERRKSCCRKLFLAHYCSVYFPITSVILCAFWLEGDFSRRRNCFRWRLAVDMESIETWKVTKDDDRLSQLPLNNFSLLFVRAKESLFKLLLPWDFRSILRLFF